jgi:hypothetical protein
MVSQYTGLNIIEVQNLDYFDYLVLRRDAFIMHCQATEDGKKYLDNAWRISQTAPDRQALRDKYGEGG